MQRIGLKYLFPTIKGGKYLGGVMVDDEIRESFVRLETKIDLLPCPARGERLAKLEQSKENGEKLEQKDQTRKSTAIGIWRIVISAIGLGIVVLEAIALVK